MGNETKKRFYGKSKEDTLFIDEPITMITPKSKWRLFDFDELVDYRDLFFFLTWRNIKVLYAQTILGFFWALLVPATQILIFTIVFHSTMLDDLNTAGGLDLIFRNE